jgi:predicted amidohydrolase YtcJ
VIWLVPRALHVNLVYQDHHISETAIIALNTPGVNTEHTDNANTKGAHATINGAYTIYEEKPRGSIETGKLADLVVLDKYALTYPEEEIKKMKVLMTIC